MERTGPVSLADSKRQGGVAVSINIYLTEAVREHTALKTVQGKKPGDEYFTLDGINIFRNNGRLYVIHGEHNPIPAILVKFVDEISYYDWIPRMCPRECGIYKHESAEGELVPDNGGGKEPKYKVFFKAKNMEDIWELVRLIKIGDIRPDQSYEKPQDGKSAKELAEEVACLKRENGQLKGRLVDLDRLADINFNLHKLRVELGRSRWPICLRVKVLRAISDIFHSGPNESQF